MTSPTKAVEELGLTQPSGQASCIDYIQVGAEAAQTALMCGPGFLTVYGTEHIGCHVTRLRCPFCCAGLISRNSRVTITIFFLGRG